MKNGLLPFLLITFVWFLAAPRHSSTGPLQHDDQSCQFSLVDHGVAEVVPEIGISVKRVVVSSLLRFIHERGSHRVRSFSALRHIVDLKPDQVAITDIHQPVKKRTFLLKIFATTPKGEDHHRS